MVVRLSRTTTALAARWPRFEPPLPLFIPQSICAHHILAIFAGPYQYSCACTYSLVWPRYFWHVFSSMYQSTVNDVRLNVGRAPLRSGRPVLIPRLVKRRNTFLPFFLGVGAHCSLCIRSSIASEPEAHFTKPCLGAVPGLRQASMMLKHDERKSKVAQLAVEGPLLCSPGRQG